jgi:hypothetical protein
VLAVLDRAYIGHLLELRLQSLVVVVVFVDDALYLGVLLVQKGLVRQGVHSFLVFLTPV